MRGAAMKVGQVLSTVDFTAIPEGEREEFKQTLASLRDDVPPLPFKRLEKLLREELGRPLGDAFADFERRGLRRRLDRPGPPRGHARRAPRRGQGPVPRASPRRSRPTCATSTCCSRSSSGWRPAGRQGARRRAARAHRARSSTTRSRRRTTAPSSAPGAGIRSPTSRPSTRALSSRRVLVTELLEGRALRGGQAARRGRARPLRRDRLPLLLRHAAATCAAARATRIPGNYLLLDDGRVGFLDFGLMRVVDADYLDARARGRARRGRPATRDGVHAGLAAAGYLPDPRAFEPERVLAQLQHRRRVVLRRPASSRSRPRYVADLMERASSPRSDFFEEMRQETLPPQALLIRRMEGLVLAVLGELRAGADWARSRAEYYDGAPPSTPLGEQDAAFWRRAAAKALGCRGRCAGRSCSRSLLLAALAPAAGGATTRTSTCRSCSRRSSARASADRRAGAAAADDALGLRAPLPGGRRDRAPGASTSPRRATATRPPPASSPSSRPSRRGGRAGAGRSGSPAGAPATSSRCPAARRARRRRSRGASPRALRDPGEGRQARAGADGQLGHPHRAALT